MAQLKDNGVPTRKTKGALGDIYTDINTGKKYKCVFSYRDDVNGDFDCQWREIIEVGKKPVKKNEAPKQEVKDVVEKKKSTEELTKHEETKEDPIKPETKKHVGKSNYTSYYNKNNQ